MDLTDWIHFAGVRKDIPELMALMDVLVLPSRTEGFSNVLLEGMASGRPIVTTRVGGNPEALDGGSCGILVPPGDPASLERGIEQLLSDPEMARDLGKRARDRAREQYGVETLYRNLRAFYRRAAVERATGDPTRRGLAE